MEDGGFTVVTHLKKRGRVKQNKSTTRSNHEGTTGALRNDVNKSVVVNAVLRCRSVTLWTFRGRVLWVGDNGGSLWHGR